MYRIDEISYMFRIPISHLKSLEKERLFKATREDLVSGYRYYDDLQLNYFNNMRILKVIGWTNQDLVRDKKKITDSFVKKMVLDYKKNNSNRGNYDSKLLDIDEFYGRNFKDTNYGVGVLDNPYVGIVGKKMNLKNRKEFDRAIKELQELFDSNDMRYTKKVFIPNTVGYSKKFPACFVGLEVPLIDFKRYQKDHLDSLGLTKRMGSRGKTTLFVMCNADEREINKAYADLIIYARNHNYQILGGFYEVYDRKVCEIFLEAYRLDENKTSLAKTRKKYPYQYVVEDDRDLLGSWELVEILPGIEFDLNTEHVMNRNKYPTIEFLENGQTNYDDLKWNKKTLISSIDGEKVYSPFYAMKLDKDIYLEVFLQDEYTLKTNAKPLSNIYVKKRGKGTK